MRSAGLALLVAVAFAWAYGTVCAAPPAAKKSELTEDEQVLKAANLGWTGPALLNFFHDRALTEVAPAKLQELVAHLADKSAPKRDAAFAKLVSLGVLAVPALRLAANNLDDLESAGRARQCLQFIEGQGGPQLSKAAVRLLAGQKPAGAVKALLSFLPYAEDDSVVQEIQKALAQVAVHDGKPDPALVRVLADQNPIRRSTAAEALCRIGGAESLAAVRPLLHDPKATVRLRVALTLANNHDAEAIPVLIDLLDVLPPAQCRQAEEYLMDLAGDWAVAVPQGNEKLLRHLRRDVWAAWWKATDGPALLQELRQRTLSDVDRDKALGWIRKLGDADLAVREKASTALVAMGTAAAPLLHQAVQDPNPRISLYAGRCLQLIEKDTPSMLPAAVVRLVALRKPAGAANALLAYVPFAENASVAEELHAALTAVAVRDGKPDPALVDGLHDQVSERRAAAAEALCAAGLASQVPALRQLLKDNAPTVRLRTALALASAQDKDAIPTLIALIAELPEDQVWQAEEPLLQLAGDNPPQAPAGNDPASRQKHRDAWANWWKEHAAKASLVALRHSGSRQRYYGYTLVVMNANGMVLELDGTGKERWRLTGLMSPTDAQVLPSNRVLVAEHNGNRVTERTLNNQIVWQKKVNWPIGCRRLPNGHTFIVSRNEVLEVNRDGRELFHLQRNLNDILAARRLRNGQITMVLSNGRVVRLDAKGNELQSFPVMYNGMFGIDQLPNGHVVLPGPWGTNKVYEYDAKGKIVWEATVQQPSSASRAPNGNTLVTRQMWPAAVVELDKNGKVVWEQRIPAYAVRAKRR